MRPANIFVVYRKELTDALRDRRTLFTTFIFPLVIFPLMSVGLGEVMESSVRRIRTDTARIALAGEEHAPELAARLRSHQGFEVAPAPDDFKQQITDMKLRAVVEFPAGFEAALAAGQSVAPIAIHYYSAEPRSQAAVRRVEEVLREHRDHVVENRLRAAGIPPAILHPVGTREQNVASAEKVGGLKLAGILPYFIILLSLMGALNPAVDMTAGEKERGTLETILASAVRRSELVLGKFLLVLTASLVTAALALASFAVTMQFSRAYAQELTRGQATSIGFTAVAAVFLLVLPLAVLFAGVMLSLALSARSFKEAQGYTGPVILLAILPAAMAMMPGVELNAKLALVPVVNVSLLAKEIFAGNYPWSLIALVFGSTCALAAAALFVAVRQFHREEVLFRS
jgi:sodium transport system permease protein